MKPDFDYNSVPHGFIHCLNGQCPQANNCLRHQIALRIPSECKTITIINPSYASATDKQCSYFMPDRTLRFARGITHLLDNIPHRNAMHIKEKMIAHFNRTTYYRFWRKERLIHPKEQEYIRQLFHNQGITDDPAFDAYEERYDW